MKQVAIVGAGISGLATAFHIHRLAQQTGLEVRVVVLEADARAGGRVGTRRVQGYQIELGANGFLDSKPTTLELCRLVGLDSELIRVRPEARNRFLFWRGRLHKLPTGPIEFLQSNLLTFGGKLRVFGDLFVSPGPAGIDESVQQFASRRIGREAAGVLVDAMVTGIHAGDPRYLSASAAFPRMVALERQHGSLIRAMLWPRRPPRDSDPAPMASEPGVTTRASPEKHPRRSDAAKPARPGGTLWSLRQGMGQLIERLEEISSAEIIRGTQVRRLARSADGSWIVSADEACWAVDAVVLACPSYAQAEILSALDPPLARLVSAIQYNSVAVVALGFDRGDVAHSLAGFGYLSPQRLRRDVLGVLWSSSIFDHRAPPGKVLLQAMCGGWNRPDIIEWPDDRLVRAVRTELEQSMGMEAAPQLIEVIRWPRAIPQYEVGHLQRLAEIDARCRAHCGLYLTGNSFRGVSMNDCTDEADRCAGAVVGEWGSARKDRASTRLLSAVN